MEQTPIPTLTLEIVTAGHTAKKLVLTATRLVVGRESGDVVLGDPEASALHAELDCMQGRVIVRDLGSRNGTWRGDERLPQFALYEGQSFRCGASTVTLVALEGVPDQPKAGQTAFGRTAAATGSTATLPGPPTPVGAGPAVQSAATPAPRIPWTPPRAEPPAASQIPAASQTQVAPVPWHAAPPREPAPSPFRAPVANALIKPGDAAGRTSGVHPPADGRNRTLRLLAYGGLGTLGIAAVVGVIFWVTTLLAGRGIAFVRDVADTLPEDTVGMLAVASPRDVLTLFGDEVPAEIRDRARQQLGFDPFDPQDWETLGIDIEAPVGLALLRVEDGVFALCVGISDREAFERTLADRLAVWMQVESLAWSKRSFESAEGLWLDGDQPAAVVFRGDRAFVLMSDDPVSPEVLSRHAEAVAATEKGSTLADRPGFAAIAAPAGDTLSMLYIDGPSLLDSLPARGMEGMVLRMGMTDFEAFSASLSHDGPRVQLSYQTVLREGSRHLELLHGPKRPTEALDQIGAPVLAELDTAIDPEAIDGAVTGLTSLATGVLGAFEREFREEIGIDPRADVLGNFDGRIGGVLTRLPSAPGERDFGMLGFVGVRDGEKAREAANTVFARAHDRLAVRSEQMDGTTVYVWDGPPKIAAFIHEGFVWVAVGAFDSRSVIEGPVSPFRKAARHDAIANALADDGATAAGFADIRELLAALRPLLDEDDKAATQKFEPLFAMLEVFTMRAAVHERTVSVTFTLHTSADEAAPALVQQTLAVAGQAMVATLERQARAQKCEKLAEHVMDLLRKELEQGGTPDPAMAVLEVCESPQMPLARIDCYLAAESIAVLQTCDAKHPAESDRPAPIDADSGPEPKPVPYVDDIWPETRHDADHDRPQSAVNYGVGLGERPQMRGPADALVTIVEFGDFQCPYCKRVASVLDEVLAEHGADVRLVFRHNPLPTHEHATLAAQAAVAAGRQDSFWSMHDKLFSQQHALSEDNVRKWAGELGLDTVRFDRDFYDRAVRDQVEQDMAEAARFGVTGTPTFFVNGRVLSGSHSKAAFDRLIVEEKARAALFVARRGDTRRRLYEDMIALFAPEATRSVAFPVLPGSDAERHIVSTAGLPQKGVLGLARVQIVECGEFDCPYCARARKTIDDVLAAYPTQVAVYWAHNPLAFHPGAEPAARAAVAADAQGKFWEMHDLLFENRSARSATDFRAWAEKLELDVVRFEADLASEATGTIIEAQQKACTDNEASGTPSFFVNGRLVTGAQPLEVFKAMIDEELAAGI